MLPMALQERHLEEQLRRGVFARVELLQSLKMRYFAPLLISLEYTRQIILAHFELFFSTDPLQTLQGHFPVYLLVALSV